MTRVRMAMARGGCSWGRWGKACGASDGCRFSLGLRLRLVRLVLLVMVLLLNLMAAVVSAANVGLDLARHPFKHVMG